MNYKQPNPRIDFASHDWYKDLWRGRSEYDGYLKEGTTEPLPNDMTVGAYRKRLEDYLTLVSEALEEDQQKASSYWTRIPQLPQPPPRYHVEDVRSIWDEIDEAHRRVRGCYEVGEGY